MNRGRLPCRSGSINGGGTAAHAGTEGILCTPAWHLDPSTSASTKRRWRGHAAGGSLAALQAVLGHGTIPVTERYGAIGDDLVAREAQRLVEFLSREESGEGRDRKGCARS